MLLRLVVTITVTKPYYYYYGGCRFSISLLDLHVIKTLIHENRIKNLEIFGQLLLVELVFKYHLCVCVRERERVCVCVCVCERERVSLCVSV